MNDSETSKYQKGAKSMSGVDVLRKVYDALSEKGYDPVNQIVGYLISGDPTYVTSYKNARFLITTIERDELLETFVAFYLEKNIVETNGDSK